MPKLANDKTIATGLGWVFMNPDHFEITMAELFQKFREEPIVMIEMTKKMLIYTMIKKAWDANDSDEFTRLVNKFIDSHEYILYSIIGTGTLGVKLSTSLDSVDDAAQNLGSDTYVSISNHLKLIYDIRKKMKIDDPDIA